MKPSVAVGTNPAVAAYHQRSKNRETAMKIAKIILAAAGVLTIVTSAALAEQMLNGTVTKVDRINNSVAIRQTQSGTVGANSGSATEEFKTQDGLSLDKLHAGDRVTFSATEKGGVKTITKIQQQ
jgi:Cu/Ag efflux protein CusF